MKACRDRLGFQGISLVFYRMVIFSRGQVDGADPRRHVGDCCSLTPPCSS